MVIRLKYVLVEKFINECYNRRIEYVQRAWKQYQKIMNKGKIQKIIVKNKEIKPKIIKKARCYNVSRESSFENYWKRMSTMEEHEMFIGCRNLEYKKW